MYFTQLKVIWLDGNKGKYIFVLPAVFLLSLSALGQDERQDQQPYDDAQHTQGERQTEWPVDGVVTGLALVAQVTLTHHIHSCTHRRHAGAVAGAVELTARGQVWMQSRICSHCTKAEKGSGTGGIKKMKT